MKVNNLDTEVVAYNPRPSIAWIYSLPLEKFCLLMKEGEIKRRGKRENMQRINC